MYCPSCGGEFRPEIDRCPDCGLALTAEPPPAGADDDDGDWQEVFKSADASLLGVVRSVLESSDIPFVLHGGEVAGIYPLGAAGSSALGGDRGRGLAARLLVPADRADEARELLAERPEAEWLPAEDDEESDPR